MFNLKQKPVTAVQHMGVGSVGYGERASNATYFTPFRGAAVGAVALIGGAANAAAIDVTSVTTDIAAQAAPVAAIGAAVLLLVVGIKAFKWVRAALS